MILVRRTVLEQKAKKIQKFKKMQWSKALDEAAKEHGFNNYRHYLNVSMKLSSVLKKSEIKLGFKNFSELLVHLKDLNMSESNEVCNNLGFNEHVKDYVLSLFRDRYLTVGSFIPNPFQLLDFSFQDFNFEAKENYIKITGNLSIQVKAPNGEPYEYKDSIKTNNRFGGQFFVKLNSNGIFSLESADISGKPL